MFLIGNNMQSCSDPHTYMRQWLVTVIKYMNNKLVYYKQFYHSDVDHNCTIPMEVA